MLFDFNDIRSALDADQKRRGNTRSPVRQCLDYLSFTRRSMIWSEPIVPPGGSSLGAIPYGARNLQESHTTRRDKLVSFAVLATIFSITERTAGKKLCDALRKLATNDRSPVVSQIMALERELASLDAEIARQERAMNALVYALGGLGAEKIEMVEKG